MKMASFSFGCLDLEQRGFFPMCYGRNSGRRTLYPSRAVPVAQAC